MEYKCWKHSGCPFMEGEKGLNKKMKCLSLDYSIEQCKKDNYKEVLDFFDKEDNIYTLKT